MRNRLQKIWKEWRGTVLFFGLVIVPIKSVLADVNWVPTGSMNPTILEGDLVYVNKASYDLRVPLTLKRVAQWDHPDHGDVIVFFSPDTQTRMVKRVIGCPGDTLELRQNIVSLNGEPLEYGHLSDEQSEGLVGDLRRHSLFAEENLDGRKHAVMSTPAIQNPKRSFGPIVVPEGRYFVMGDNRDNSMDSRFYGFINRESIVGEAKRVIVSFDINNWIKPRLGRFGQSLK